MREEKDGGKEGERARYKGLIRIKKLGFIPGVTHHGMAVGREIQGLAFFKK